MGSPPKIAVFDSGFGGLTVLKALIEVVPQAEYLYFGDTARLPYGSKSVETVAKYASEAARFLEEQGAELLVVACNSATALAFPQIQESVSVQTVGVVEPGARQAFAASRSRKVVVVGTEATTCSHAYQKALAKLDVEAFEKACPLLVPLVEEGWVDHPVTEQVARIYLAEAFADGFSSADVLLLGCTHYPLLKPLLRRIVPNGVALVDSADSTAFTVAELLKSNAPTANRTDKSRDSTVIRFFVTDSVQKFQRLGKLFLGRPMTDVTHVELKE
ncbi:MAG TPA: glutamate racemase [Terriglobales bacterium]|nr:glutamate racemase [Terriglobales bacterium]